jgi:hypothetical protein
MNTFKRLLAVIVFVACSQYALANNGDSGEKGNKKVAEGSVHGYVMDATTRKPVGGVTVSVSSNKMQGEKEIQSDASGYFNFGRLPAGEVTILFEKKGYKLYKRDVLPLKQGTIVKMSVEVHPDEDANNDIWHPLFKLLNDE